jgi:hypothetical protein
MIMPAVRFVTSTGSAELQACWAATPRKAANMAQTKAQRSEAAKKAAATRKRNREAALQEAESHETRRAIDDAVSTVAEAAKNVSEHLGKLSKTTADSVKAEIDRRR